MRILVVDDQTECAAVLAMLLRADDREIAVCHSGAECLERVDSFRPQLVLLDINMPGIDGWETARRLRARHPDVQLIAVTSLDSHEDRQRSKEAGFHRHMTKPVPLNHLLPILKQLSAV